MLLSWAKHTDRKGSTVRVVLFDDNRAFDLINQVIPATKLTSLRHYWSERNDKGRPEFHGGTKLGPWLFILKIDDVSVNNMDLWKYVDDTTLAEPVDDSKRENANTHRTFSASDYQ
ncbi:unnamed protein product [Porites evermanni]|uniref:Uncharacterized protein n=1 Tax=Porites evermanni TaxID=104178 RepID=A0ABN8M9J4_9CNID|nr:unnamed protein product [Porites evermanni]